MLPALKKKEIKGTKESKSKLRNRKSKGRYETPELIQMSGDAVGIIR
jgi:hypothetical protein